MISEKVRKAFKAEAEKYLGSQSLGALRNYGRDIGVYAPTKQNKGGLIEQIVEILAGEREPVPQSKRGAPVLDDRVDPRIVQEMNRLSLLHFSGSSEEESMETPKEEPKVEYFNEEHYKAFRKAYKEMQEHKVMLRVSAPSAEDCEDEVRVGQLRTLDSVPRLLPLDCPEFGEQIAVSNDFVRHYDLQEGDVISCHARKSNNIYVATTILEVNGTKAEDFYRCLFRSRTWLYPRNQAQRRICCRSASIPTRSRLFFHSARKATALCNRPSAFRLRFPQNPSRSCAKARVARSRSHRNRAAAQALRRERR